MMNEERAEKAVRESGIEWLAGFYEGEGNPVWNRYFGLRIAQKERDVLDWVISVFGGSVRDNGRGVFNWALSHGNAVKLAHEMLGHMHSPTKIEQLKRALILTGYLEPRMTSEAEEVVAHRELMERRKVEDSVKRREYMRNFYLERRREQEVLTRDWIRKHPREIVGIAQKEVS